VKCKKENEEDEEEVEDYNKMHPNKIAVLAQEQVDKILIYKNKDSTYGKEQDVEKENQKK
jgi:hypothetical protein